MKTLKAQIIWFEFYIHIEKTIGSFEPLEGHTTAG